MGPPFDAIGLGQVPKGLIGGMDDYRCRLVVFVQVLAIAKSPPPAATWYDSGASHHMERTGHSPFLACECRGTSLRRRRSSVARLLTTVWFTALVLPHATWHGRARSMRDRGLQLAQSCRRAKPA